MIKAHFCSTLRFFVLKWPKSSLFGRFSIYGELLEMPQKVCGGDILHVMAYAFVFEMPQNRTYLFSVLSPFSESDGQNGAFQDFRT